MSGICKSTIRHSGSSSGNAARKSQADVYVLTSNALARNNRAKPFSTDGSSSTIAIQGEARAMWVLSASPRRIVELALRPTMPRTGYDLL